MPDVPAASFASRAVVITRPLAQAASLAQRVRSLGREVVVLPLLDIAALPEGGELHQQLQQQLAKLDQFALVAFVSPNALQYCFAEMVRMQLTWPASTPIAVMGEGSRQILAHLPSNGAKVYFPQDTQRTDSETLLQALDLSQLRGKSALIVRGQTGRELLGDALRAEGVEVVQVAAYQRLGAQLDAAMQAKLSEMLAAQHDWLITSSEALRHLLEILQKMQESAADFSAVYAKIVANMQQQHLIVPHVRIAETARSLGFCHITLSAAGDEGMLTALQSLHYNHTYE